MNHWILPARRLASRDNIYLQLLWLRRLLIAAVFVRGYLLDWLLDNRQNLATLALLAFIETLQFLPSMFAIVFWPKGNRRGLIAGLAAGTLIWFVGLLVPVFTGVSSFTVPGLDFTIPLGMQFWSGVALLSLGVNTSFFVGVSALTRDRKSTELQSRGHLVCR